MTTDATDWDAVAAIPIYGMPESVPGRIVTSPEPAQWWQDYWDSLRPDLPAPALDKVTQAYGRPPDFTIMADLVAVHELTHLFHDIHPVTWASEFPEIWVMELFANLGMYGYVATHHPEHLPLLHSLTGATLAAGTAPWRFTALDAMGDSMRGRVEHYSVVPVPPHRHGRHDLGRTRDRRADRLPDQFGRPRPGCRRNSRPPRRDRPHHGRQRPSLARLTDGHASPTIHSARTRGA